MNQASSKRDRDNWSLRDGRMRVFRLGTVLGARLNEGAQPQRMNVGKPLPVVGTGPMTHRTGPPQLPSVCKQVCEPHR